MSKVVLHTDDTGVSATLVFKDKKGNVTSLPAGSVSPKAIRPRASTQFI